MTQYAPIWLQSFGPGYSAANDRALISATLIANGIVRGARTLFGTTPVGDFQATHRQIGASTSVDVNSGYLCIAGRDTTTLQQGHYLVYQDAPVNVPIHSPFPGSGQSRNDILIAAVRDSTMIGGSNNDYVLAFVSGTAATTGTQSDPPLSAYPYASYVQLARVVVPSSGIIQDSAITDLRPQSWHRSLQSISLNQHTVNNGGTTGVDSTIGGTVNIIADGTYDVSVGIDVFCGTSSTNGGAVIIYLNSSTTGEYRRLRFPAFVNSDHHQVTADFSMDLVYGDVLGLTYHNANSPMDSGNFAFAFGGQNAPDGTAADTASWFEVRRSRP